MITTAVLTALLASTLILLYIKAFPHPLPGIPFYAPSAKKLFGDLSDLVKHQKETGETWSFFSQRCKQLKVPVFQAFPFPFTSPWVFVADAQISHYYLTRRAQELDRSDFVIDFFKEFFSHQQITMKTGEAWRANRKLIASAMSPPFLRNVVLHHVRLVAQDLIELWKVKMSLANDLPFNAHKDIFRAMVEISWTTTLGSDVFATKTQLEALRKSKSSRQAAARTGKEAVFEHVEDPAELEALLHCVESFQIKTNIPILGHAVFRFMYSMVPKYRDAKARVDRAINRQLDHAYQLCTSSTNHQLPIQSTAHMLVSQAVKATKTSAATSEAQYKTPRITEELLGLMFGGSEALPSTVGWGLKLLTQNQLVQEQLRCVLRESLSTSTQEDNSAHILSTSIPYLDAVMEEIYRTSNITQLVARTASVDTDIMGYHVPKGSEICFMLSGPGYTEPRVVQKEELSKLPEVRGNSWDPKDVHLFKPERWLRASEDGKEQFDMQAGPSGPFAFGPRACFGQRLARMMLRLIFALIVLEFDLRPVPHDLMDFAAHDISFHVPRNAYVRLGEPE